ncbi:MAG: hypothetical protein KDC35_09970 [Acidobacteria bacterium]|nr:hypothetical protein [Acidobacteriota bacterium]
MRSIVAILPRGEAIRNFAYNGVLRRINQRLSVRVLSVIPCEVVHKALRLSGSEIEQLTDLGMPWIMRYVYKIMDMAHGRMIWSRAAEERWKNRDRESRVRQKQIRRWVNKVVAILFAHRVGLSLLERILLILYRFNRKPQVIAYYDRVQPVLVFNGSHVHCMIAVPYLLEARLRRIPIASFLFSWDNLTSQGRIIPQSRYYLAWNRHIQQQLLNMYPNCRQEHTVAVGTPQFDIHQVEPSISKTDFMTLHGLLPSRPVVLYTSGMPNHMPGEPEIVRNIADLFSFISPKPQMALRVYGKDRTGRFDSLKKHPDIVFMPDYWEPSYHTPLPEDDSHYAHLLRYCDVGINIASTVSLELMMYDKPVINVAYQATGEMPPVPFRSFYDFDHYKPLVESGAVSLVEHEEDMKDALKRALDEPNQLAYQRAHLLQSFFDPQLDGHAGDRIAHQIATWAEAL